MKVCFDPIERGILYHVYSVNRDWLEITMYTTDEERGAIV